MQQIVALSHKGRLSIPYMCKSGFVRRATYNMHQTLTVTLCSEARPERTVRDLVYSVHLCILECAIMDYYKLIHEMNVIITFFCMHVKREIDKQYNVISAV